MRKGKKAESLVDESIRRYKDAEREKAEKSIQVKERVALAIRFQNNSWLFQGTHLRALTSDEVLRNDLEAQNFIASRTTLYMRTKKRLKDLLFKKKVRIQEVGIDRERYFAEKQQRQRKFLDQLNLIKEATDLLNIPKIPPHHEDAMYIPDYQTGITEEKIMFDEKYLEANMPLRNPPNVEQVLEDLLPVDEAVKLIKAQNGDEYCPGRIHNYLGKSRLYSLRIAPSTASTLFRFSGQPVYPEDALLPSKKQVEADATKSKKWTEMLMRPFYRFKRGALDISRKHVAQHTAAADKAKKHQLVEFDDIGNSMTELSLSGPVVPDRGALIPTNICGNTKHRHENQFVHTYGPPETPDLIGYGNSRSLVKRDFHKGSVSVVPSSIARLDNTEPEVADSIFEESTLNNTLVSADIKREYHSNYKSVYDRSNIATDIHEKFIAKKEQKRRLMEYYPHKDTAAAPELVAYDKFGNRLIKNFNYHSAGFEEIGETDLFNPQQSLSSSRQHFVDGGTLNGTDDFIQHFPSLTDNSSSVMSNNQSRYLALQNGHFVNDNDTHIASRSSKLSINSLDSRYHVKCKLQKQRTLRGLDKFHLKKGLNLVSSSRRKLQRQERDHNREVSDDLKDKRDFLQMALKKK